METLLNAETLQKIEQAYDSPLLFLLPVLVLLSLGWSLQHQIRALRARGSSR